MQRKQSSNNLMPPPHLKSKGSSNSLRNASFDESFATVASTLDSDEEEDDDDDDDGNEDDFEDYGTPAVSGRSQWSYPSPDYDEADTGSYDIARQPPDLRPGAPPAKDWREQLARTALFDEYVQRVVYQSGTDYQGRPIVILSSPALPDPKLVDYNMLLQRILDQMELFVQNDYSVVFFAGGSSHRPPWSWLWSSYQRLSRPFRKNCKRLFICHPTFFTRSFVRIISTGSAVLSPKFARKITQVNTLSQLAEYIDLRQIEIPPEVLQWNMKYEKEVKLPERPANVAGGSDAASPVPDRVFGLPIQVLMGEKGEKGGLPRVVRDCVEELQRLVQSSDGSRHSGVDTEGIFRKSASSALLQAAQQAYDLGQPVSLSQWNDPNLAAALLKLYFRKLPDPIFPASTYPLIRACPPPQSDSNGETIQYLRGVLLPAIFPPSKLILLSYVVELLHLTAQRSERNKMDSTNLATVWGPNLVKSNDPLRDMAICAVKGAPQMTTGMAPPSDNDANEESSTPPVASCTLGTILRVCIDHYYEIFEYDYLDYEPPTFRPQSFHDLEESQNEKLPVDAGAMSPLASPTMSASRPAKHSRNLSASSASSHGTYLSSMASPRRRSVGLGAAPGRSLGDHLGLESPTRAVSSPRVPRTTSSKDGGSGSLHSSGNGLGLGLSGPLGKGLGSPTIVGRSASGSLRLTKARLGSISNGSGMSLGGINVAEGPTGTTSGVTLTSMSALGFFSRGGEGEADGREGELAVPQTSPLSMNAASGSGSASPTTPSAMPSSAAPTLSAGPASSQRRSYPTTPVQSEMNPEHSTEGGMPVTAKATMSSGPTLSRKTSSDRLKALLNNGKGKRPLSGVEEDEDL